MFSWTAEHQTNKESSSAETLTEIKLWRSSPEREKMSSRTESLFIISAVDSLDVSSSDRSDQTRIFLGAAVIPRYSSQSHWTRLIPFRCLLTLPDSSRGGATRHRPIREQRETRTRPLRRGTGMLQMTIYFLP